MLAHVSALTLVPNLAWPPSGLGTVPCGETIGALDGTAAKWYFRITHRKHTERLQSTDGSGFSLTSLSH